MRKIEEDVVIEFTVIVSTNGVGRVFHSLNTTLSCRTVCSFDAVLANKFHPHTSHAATIVGFIRERKMPLGNHLSVVHSQESR